MSVEVNDFVEAVVKSTEDFFVRRGVELDDPDVKALFEVIRRDPEDWLQVMRVCNVPFTA